MTWVDNAYFAPEALMDPQGRLIMWAWMLDNPPDNVRLTQGWSGIYGLPRLLWLGEDGTLRMRPVDELKALRQELREWHDIVVVPDTEMEIEGLDEELLELEITMLPGDADQCGVKVCCSGDDREETLIYYDAAEKMLKVDTQESSLGFGRKTIEAAPFELAEGEALTLRIFVDRAVVEVYANERQAIGRRIYPTLDGRGVKLFSAGGEVSAPLVRAWEMMPSNPF